MRRSGLLGIDDTPYGSDPWARGLSWDQSEHWRALKTWLDARYTLRDLTADTPLPPDTDPHATLMVITKGREELSELREGEVRT